MRGILKTCIKLGKFGRNQAVFSECLSCVVSNNAKKKSKPSGSPFVTSMYPTIDFPNIDEDFIGNIASLQAISEPMMST